MLNAIETLPSMVACLSFFLAAEVAWSSTGYKWVYDESLCSDCMYDI